jgi:RNA polymerase sigma-70 factor (ECF subfamily)
MKRTDKTATSSSANSALDDVQLIGQCVRGDREAKERLARECLPLVRKLVYLGYGRRPDTEDVVQTVLVAVFRDLGELRNHGAFRAWMYRISYNVICSHGTRRSRLLKLFSHDPDIDERPSTHHLSPESSTYRTQFFDRLAQHLEKLKYKKRIAVTLSMFYGYVDAEIGEIMGCTSETAKKRVQHGRRELIKAVQRDPVCRKMMEEAAI